MKAFILVGSALAVFANAAVNAAPPSQSRARTVQLISMTAPAAAPAAPGGMPAPEGEGAPSSPPAGAPEIPASFRVHDLSRRWVQFQMAQSYSGAAEVAHRPAEPGEENSFAHVGVAPPVGRVAAADPAPSVSDIRVPAWMRGAMAFARASAAYPPGCYPGDYRPTGFLTAAAEYRRAGYYGMMSAIACQYGIPVGLFDAMIIRESRYNDGAVSSKNAYGLTQLMPGTAAGLGVNRYDAEQNLHGGARYLRQQLDRFGQVHLALAAYNAGPGRVRNGLVPRIAETQAYVDDILLNWRRLAGFTRQASVSGSWAGPETGLRSARALVREATVSTF